jgi:hypothetical protein
MHTKFYLENLKERDHLGDQDVHGRIILKWSLRNGVYVCGLDGTELVQNGVHWWDLMNDVIYLHIPQNSGVFIR